MRDSRSRCSLADDPGVVGDDFAVRVEDGFVALDGDGAGDGFDDAEDGGAAVFVGLGGLRAAGLVGANLVEEAAGCRCWCPLL